MATPSPAPTVSSSSHALVVPLPLTPSSSVPPASSVTLETVPTDRIDIPITQPPNTQQEVTPRPWWRPPARNFRPHPGNHAIDPYITSNTLVVAQSSMAEGSAPHTLSAARPAVYSESLPHYWFRALNYILRIPFRELIGNVSRPYDPTAPLSLPDVPLSANIIDTGTNQSFTNPFTGNQSSASNQHHGTGTGTGTGTQASATSLGVPREHSTTRSRGYIPQIRKSWNDRTSDMSWALSTAFFTSVLFTMVAISALAIEWEADCTYLKVFLIAFVVRKWVASFLMMDRALYRLPLGLTEPDPDIDEERHNGVAIYMSHLFTWHGYAMLLFGSCYVIFYGSSHYTSSGPVITNVAIAFSCMGLAPFFALMFVLLGALILLYTFYILFVCLIWPLEKCGLSRRRAISRRNGGYRSNGTTNTTDLREIERAIENAENGGSGGGGFGGMDNIKLTPAVAAIPIVIFRKPKIKQADTIPNAVCGIATSSQQETVIANREDPEFVKASVDLTAETVEEIQDIKEPKKPQKVHGKPETIEDTTEEHLEVVSGDHHINHTGSSQATSDRYVATSIPSANDSHNDAINKMPSNLSALGISTTGLPRTYTPSPRSRSSSVSLTGYTGSSWMGNTASQTLPAAPFIPCVTGQEMTEVEARLRPGTPASVTTANSQRPAYGLPKSSSSSRSVIININSDSNSSGAKNKQSSYMNQRVSITSSGGIASANATATGTGSVSESRSVKDHPTIYDEECAICLFDFEDGDELRHLYCDHFFHRSCVDRWLTKNAFCPKCKRGI